MIKTEVYYQRENLRFTTTEELKIDAEKQIALGKTEVIYTTVIVATAAANG